MSERWLDSFKCNYSKQYFVLTQRLKSTNLAGSFLCLGTCDLNLQTLAHLK